MDERDPVVPARNGQHPRPIPKQDERDAVSSLRGATPALRLETAATLAVGAGQDGCR